MSFFQSNGIRFPYVVVVLCISIVEMVLYFLKVGWAYRIGPVLTRQIWATTVSVEQADAAVHTALSMRTKLTFSREVCDGVIHYNIRKAFWRASLWPYLTLRIEPSPTGSVIHYAARPFLSMVLFMPIALMVPPWFPIPQSLLWLLIGMGIPACYAALFMWELPALDGIEGVRAQLAMIGVRVCHNCGHDLRANAERCSKCGETIATQMRG